MIFIIYVKLKLLFTLVKRCFRCPICGKKFRENGNLKTHIRLHVLLIIVLKYNYYYFLFLFFVLYQKIYCNYMFLSIFKFLFDYFFYFTNN